MLRQSAKYNPAFLSEERLVESFVARHAELSLILGILKENIGQASNQHLLILGQRGIGKTTLALRVAAEVQRDHELKDAWFPLIFAEESYQVATPGEFWLEAIFHLAEKTDDERWKRVYNELKGEADEIRLRERALAQLMDYTDSIGKRLLLIVENLDMLLADQMGTEDAWALRHTLQNEPRIMMLATALRRFDEIGAIDKAMYELFKVYELKPLTNDECRAVWTSITGKEITEHRIKPIQILTGGNPRLLTIISSFGANLSFKQLMSDIMQLVDDHTEYFKSHLDSLAPVERKVYLALAELWDPSPARDVASAARLDVNKTSSLLNRLVERGAVMIVDGGKRTKWYQLAERMYNIYYLMRRRGAPSSRVQAVVNFMVSFYDDEELLNITKCIAVEACQLPPEQKEYNYFAYKSIVERMVSRKLADKFIKETPQEFFKHANIPESVEKDFIFQISSASSKGEKRGSVKTETELELKALLRKAERLSKKPERVNDALELYKKALEIEPDSSTVWVKYGATLSDIGRYDDAEQTFRKAIEINPKYAWPWIELGRLFHDKLERYDEAEPAYRKAIEINPKNDWPWIKLGQLLHDKLERYDEAEQVFRKAIEIDHKDAWPWIELGQLLHDRLERYDEAEQAYRKAIEINPENAWTWAHLGQLLFEKLQRHEEAEFAINKAIEVQPKAAEGWVWLGQFLNNKLNKPDMAKTVFKKAMTYKPLCINAVNCLMDMYLQNNNPSKCIDFYSEYQEEVDKSSAALNTMAWAYFRCGQPEYLGIAEEWANRAVELTPENACIQHTLASIQTAEGKCDDALEHSEQFLQDAEVVRNCLEDATDLMVNLAARGFAEKALEMIIESPSAEILEPLIVGIRLYLGEDVRVATEILEVGKDVAERIREREGLLKDSDKTCR